MRRFTTRIVVTALVLGGILASGDEASRPAGAQEPPPPLPDALVRLIERLEGLPPPGDESLAEPPAGAPDPNAPSFRLPAAIAALEDLLRTANARERKPIGEALKDTRMAWERFTNGSGDLSLSHLSKTLESLQRAGTSLLVAKLLADNPADARIDEVHGSLAMVARRIAHDVSEQARRAGVAPRRLMPALRLIQLGDRAIADQRYEVATLLYGNGLGLAADTITFDIDLFEQNIRDIFDPLTVGYAYSITLSGQIHRSGFDGLARTAVDPPETAQSPNKETQVASVSKMLTGILTLRLLDENGLTPDDPIAPWLPSDWTLGDGVDALTFADVMTHHSGFEQNAVAGSSYAPLQEVIAKDVGATGYEYNNANFGMQRVLIAGLLGVDPVDYPMFDPAALTAALFISYAQQTYGSIGISVDCKANDATQLVQYKFPDTGNPGYLEPDRSLSCGGFGFFISPNELAGVITTLRYTEDLLSEESFDLMKDGFLGFLDPNEFSWTNGAFGLYYNHGGDWDHGAGGLDSCVMMFPIVVEVSLVANSSGSYPNTHQCSALRNAFDAAWVAD